MLKKLIITTIITLFPLIAFSQIKLTCLRSEGCIIEDGVCITCNDQNRHLYYIPPEIKTNKDTSKYKNTFTYEDIWVFFYKQNTLKCQRFENTSEGFKSLCRNDVYGFWEETQYVYNFNPELLKQKKELWSLANFIPSKGGFHYMNHINYDLENVCNSELFKDDFKTKWVYKYVEDHYKLVMPSTDKKAAENDEIFWTPYSACMLNIFIRDNRKFEIKKVKDKFVYGIHGEKIKALVEEYRELVNTSYFKLFDILSKS